MSAIFFLSIYLLLEEVYYNDFYNSPINLNLSINYTLRNSLFTADDNKADLSPKMRLETSRAAEEVL